MPRFRCLSCNSPVGYEFTADGPQCPSCKRTSGVLPLVDVHWLESHAEGRIPGHDGPVRVACMPLRPSLVKLSASVVPSVVTCPACRLTDSFRRVWDEWAAEWPDLAREWAEKQTNKG